MARCEKCKKKILMTFTCSCEHVFCIKCRMPEDHMCTFDYVKAFQEKLTRDNEVVKGEKVAKI